jgi:hypothetical protein
MTAPTHPCGCAGTWAIVFRYAGNNYNNSTAGYENDAPYLKSIGGKDYLYSACDNRDMLGGEEWVGISGLAPIQSATFTKTDPNCGSQESIIYDCINGACIPKTTYNTPGLYQSLSECETACGTGCSGKCISSSDWAQIEGLANKLKSKNCS